MSTTQTSGHEIEFLKRLRAVRQFRAEPISEDALQDILEVVRWSGSASNRQPWQVVLIRDPQVLKALADLEGYAGHLAGASAGIVVVSSGQSPERDAFDEGRLSERIMLAASAHGIGSSIGWLSGAGREQARELLGAPTGRLVRTTISLGYPAQGSERGRRRRPLQELVHYDRF